MSLRPKAPAPPTVSAGHGHKGHGTNSPNNMHMHTHAHNVPTPPLQNIVDTALSAKVFTTLVTAIQTAGLTEVLKSDGTSTVFTVFAPTDDAFKKLPKGLVDKLLKNPTLLKRILLHHVVLNQRFLQNTLKDGGMLEMMSNANLEVSTSENGNTLKIGDANITNANIMCANGVIHVIDCVLVPKNIIQSL